MEERNVLLVFKDARMTSLAQAGGVFEPFKFIGRMEEWECKVHGDATAEQILDAVTPNGAVGVAIKGIGWAISPGHRVISDGQKWGVLETILQRHAEVN